MPTLEQQRQSIRQTIRQLRQQLRPSEQEIAAQQVVQHIMKQLSRYTKPPIVGLFLSFDGELNTTKILKQLWHNCFQTTVPIIHPFNKQYLLFQSITDTTEQRVNRFGIQEPRLNCIEVVPIISIDVLFVPLVAFDDKGQRLGMGGGFYDRVLPFVRSDCEVIGLAHDCQQVEYIPVQEWDISLQQIITPTRHFHFN